MKPLSILVIDDEESIRTLLGLILERHAHKVATAASGRAALQLLATEPFELMITDIIMPDMDGIEIITAARKLRPATRILAISGGGAVMASHDCLKMAKMIGAHAVLPKPFNEAQLLAAIALALPAPVPAAG
jgi:CheY-like chemotaxis protein